MTEFMVHYDMEYKGVTYLPNHLHRSSIDKVRCDYSCEPGRPIGANGRVSRLLRIQVALLK